MAVGLRPSQYSPIPVPSGTRYTDISKWEVDSGRRLAPGGGVNGQAGDSWPGPNFAFTTMQPFVAQPGPVYRQDQHGGPTQNPKQPYRARAGFIVNVSMYPKPLAPGNLGPYVHQYGGSASYGVPVTDSLRKRMAALIASRSLPSKKGK